MKWNKNGNSVLLMTSTDVDTSGASYYGKQTLHFLDIKGTSAMVQLRNYYFIITIYFYLLNILDCILIIFE